MSRILLIHKYSACVSTIAFPSPSLSDHFNASMHCTSVAHSKLCLFGTYHWLSLATDFSVLSLTGSTALSLSLSLSLRGIVLFTAQSTAPSNGVSWSSLFGLRSRPEFRSGQRRWHALLCAASSIGGGAWLRTTSGLQHPLSAGDPVLTAWSAAPSAVRSQPARAIAPPIVG